MRKLLFTILVAIAAGCSVTSTGNKGDPIQATGSPEDRGNDIVAEHLRRDAAPYRKDRVRFTIREQDGKTEIDEIDVWRRQTEDTTTSLSLVVKPQEDAGAGSLSIEEKGKPAVNVTYSSARNEFRETDTGKMFFGGLTAQELLGSWDMYTFKFIADRELEGSKCFELEGKLKQDGKSSIAMERILIDSETFLPLEMHLFDPNGKELRTYSRGEIKSVNGRPYVARTEVDNYVYNSHITIEILSREFPQQLDDAMFTREKLKISAKK